MSEKHRCHKCGHRPGRRTTAVITKKGSRNPSKKPCHCECHHIERVEEATE